MFKLLLTLSLKEQVDQLTFEGLSTNIARVKMEMISRNSTLALEQHGF